MPRGRRRVEALEVLAGRETGWTTQKGSNDATQRMSSDWLKPGAVQNVGRKECERAGIPARARA